MKENWKLYYYTTSGLIWQNLRENDTEQTPQTPGHG